VEKNENANPQRIAETISAVEADALHRAPTPAAACSPSPRRACATVAEVNEAVVGDRHKKHAGTLSLASSA